MEKETEDEGEVEVFNVTEIQKLLAHAKNDLLSVVAIGAFAGLRSEEIRRLDGSDVNLGEGHIEVRRAIAKTRVRRIVPMQTNFINWLLPHARKAGPVCVYANYGNQLWKLASNAGVEWKRNGLRHSYISYRVAVTENIHQTAMEAGNTPTVITPNYLKCVTKKQAQRWFAVQPAKSDGVVVPPTSAVPATDVSQESETERQVQASGRTHGT